jgi:eukaryotic-like serine/threonine-protein kinase
LRYPEGTEVCTADGERLLSDRALSDADEDLPAGSMVGEYRLEEKLGHGGFGTVHRAVHAVIGKVAAVKILHRAYSGDAQMISRFIAEARAVNQIRHKNIIDIFAFGRVDDGRHYFVMELLEGESLERLLQREQRMPVELALKALRPVARALDAAHAAGIAHRDLKPDNVYVTYAEDGAIVPKLLDFGIAKLLAGDDSSHKTETGTPIGTPQYMSPEQCRGVSIDQRTDIYSFGVLCYRMLTGRLPFEAATSLDVMFKQIHDQAPPPSSLTGELPASFDEPIAAMLAKDPAARPATVEAALDALSRAAAQAGFAVEPVSAGKRKPPASAPPPGDPVRVIAGSQTKLGTPTYAQARTLEASTPAPKTLGASERDVRTSRRPGRQRVLLVAGVAGLAVLAGALLLATRGPGASPTPALASETALLAAPSGAEPELEFAPPAAPEPAPPREVTIAISGAPPGAVVFLGDQRLGQASDSLRLPFGTQPIELTLKSKRFKPTSLTLTPSRDQTIAAPEALPLRPGGRRPTQPRPEYEDPF